MPTDRPRRHELRGALLGGSISAFALFAVVVGVGSVGRFEALRLIEAVLPTARFLASAVVTAAITVLALLLTLIGLSLTSDLRFRPRIYGRARYITTLSIACIVVSVALLLAVSVPVGEVENLRRWYAALYYVLAGAMAVVGGLVVAIGLMIGATLRDLIEFGDPEGASDLVEDRDRAGVDGVAAER